MKDFGLDLRLVLEKIHRVTNQFSRKQRLPRQGTMADRITRQAVLRILLSVGICLLAASGTGLHAHAADDSSATDEQTPWYHGFRFQLGGYVKTILIDVEQKSKAQSAFGSSGTCQSLCASLRSDFELSPAFLASTPEWIFSKSSAASLGVALFLGGSTFSATQQKVQKFNSSDSADQYKDLGTGLRGNFLYVAPVLVAAAEHFRGGVGIGVGRGQIDGNVYLSGDGKIPVDSHGDPLPGTPRVAIRESSPTATALLLFLEGIFGNTVVSFGIGGPFIKGGKYTAVIGDMRAGVSYEFRL